ncbi:MAG TPA: hypothetical protein ENJ42_10135 [Hellea balneolensis]|uniref:Intein C-terminal splicing domain-containing protein n=1 Tax=Hellea balneolensis TaxID=287478 RepID=A0A7C5R7Y7_9PROT|nr:hypothetical protein [Hellea balneolensis]
MDAADLLTGDRLLNDDGSWAEVVSSEVLAEPLRAYNLTVEGWHTYFVAANVDAAPVWVHNWCFSSRITKRMNAAVDIDGGTATIGFKQRRAKSLSTVDIRKLKAELREQGVQTVIVNSGEIVEPSGRLLRIFQNKADTGGTWAGLNVFATGNLTNPFISSGNL